MFRHGVGFGGGSICRFSIVLDKVMGETCSKERGVHFSIVGSVAMVSRVVQYFFHFAVEVLTGTPAQLPKGICAIDRRDQRRDFLI